MTGMKDEMNRMKKEVHTEIKRMKEAKTYYD